MKHQVWTVLLFVSFSLCAENVIADKLDRIGRFSYEDSFDENLVETVLKNSSPVVKRNVKRLLYPDGGQEEMQRLLLLGGTSNASTIAIAKAIAVRCGYEYYVIEASALLQAYREGRQMLLNEVRPIIKQGKPIAIIITELAEMADYSGLLASTLWLLIDQCAQYQDVFVIATSAFKKEQLSQEIKDRFNGDIISVALDKSMRDRIEDETVKKMSWLERNKIACLIVGGLACFALGVAHLYAQVLFADAQAARENVMILLENKILSVYEKMLFVGKEMQDQQCRIQGQQYDMQKQQSYVCKEQCNIQNQQGNTQKKQEDIQKQQTDIQKGQNSIQEQQSKLQIQQDNNQKQQNTSIATKLEEIKKLNDQILQVSKTRPACSGVTKTVYETVYVTEEKGNGSWS